MPRSKRKRSISDSRSRATKRQRRQLSPARCKSRSPPRCQRKGCPPRGKNWLDDVSMAATAGSSRPGPAFVGRGRGRGRGRGLGSAQANRSDQTRPGAASSSSIPYRPFEQSVSTPSVFDRLGRVQSSASSLINVLFIGHSFVVRANRYLQQQRIYNLGLDPNHVRVTFAGRGGASVHHMQGQFQEHTRQQMPDVLLIDIGTNDMSSVRSEQQAATLAIKVADLAQNLNSAGVKTVIILELLPRTTWGRHRAGPEFTTYANLYNLRIRNMCEGRNRDLGTDLRFWHHGNLSSNPNDVILDGVHLNDHGLQIYTESLKQCVIQSQQ